MTPEPQDSVYLGPGNEDLADPWETRADVAGRAEFDIRIDGGVVVTMDRDRRVFDRGRVGINGKQIIFVGQMEDPRGNKPARKIIHASGRLILPGFVDAHVHHCQMLARGLADDVDLLTWCYEIIYPFEAALGEEEAYLGALLCVAEMIRTGTTCAVDPGGYRMDAVGRALMHSGMRGMLSWAGTDVTAPERSLPREFPGLLDTGATVEREREVFERWMGQAGGRIRVSYSVRTDVNGSLSLAERLHDLAEKDDTLVQMHCAVTREQADYARSHPDVAGIQQLAAAGLLSSRWLLIHFAAVGEAEVNSVLDHDVAICHVPGASAHGGYGACSQGRFPELIAGEARVALGCDSSCANNSLDMVRAMFQAATGHKEARQNATLIRPEEALLLATIQGARAVRWDDEIGSLEEGKKADLIVVDMSGPGWYPRHDFSIIPTLVYAGSGLDVATSVIDGQVVMEDRKLLTVDWDELVQEAQAAAESVASRLPAALRWKPWAAPT